MFAYMAARHLDMHKNAFVFFLVHRRELVQQTVSTFDALGISRDRVYIGMVQSQAKLKNLAEPSMIMFDEAHHATAKTWTNVIDMFPNSITIGLTATPIRMSGAPLGHIFDSIVCGPNTKQLIENKYLAPFEYYAPKLSSINPSEFITRGSEFDQTQVSEIYLKSKIYGDVRKYIDLSRKTIIYCPTLEFSRVLEREIEGVVHFDGSTPAAERLSIVERFRNGEIRVLSNVDLIGEGFDVPDCDTVILLRPTKSTALYIQQSTRAMRYQPGKVAKIFDLVGNVFLHGMPDEDRVWTLDKSMKARNRTEVEEVTVRTCKTCMRAYPGTNRICPYCSSDNGKTPHQIKQELQAELEKIEKIEKYNNRREQGQAQSYEQLIALGVKRGYKNPSYWAKNIIRSRGRK